MLPKGNGKPCPSCSNISPSRQSRWRLTPPAMRDDFDRSLRNEASPPISHPSQARIQHGRERGFRVPGRPSGLSPGQGGEAGRLSPPDRQLPVRGATEGLPGLSGEGRVPATQSETPAPGADHLLPAAPPGPGKESDSSLPAGDEPASGGCRGNIRIIRPTGVGEIAAKGVVEEPALEKSGVDCEGFMASIAHNLLKALRRLGHGAGPPQPADLDGCARSHRLALRERQCLVGLAPTS